MKKIVMISSVFFCSLFVIQSCKRAESEPRDLTTPDLVWDTKDKNAVLAQQFLNNIYTYLPVGYLRIGGDYLDAASGDAVPSRNNTTIQYYNNGLISTVNNPDGYWSDSYTGIRQANIFLANIDQVPAAAARITTWKAEVRFLRAFMYFELWKRYGGVPLIGDQIFTLKDDLQLPRNSFDEVLAYMIKECDAIKGDLNADALQSVDIGRIPKGAAIALKCRVYLYAASPLFNGGGVETDVKLKALTGSLNADATRWQKVIDAAEELRSLNYYALEGSYTSLFTNKTSKEVILAKQAINNFDIENYNAPVGYVVNNTTQGGRTSPTQNFIDAFPMISGLAINETGSNYSGNAPYSNRDPRLSASVFYDGLRWLSRNVETFDGGKDKPGGSIVQTKTGYYLKKFMGDFTNNTAYSNQSHNFIYFRYAEILLNYAEALNEQNRVEEAVQQIIPLRRRAGLQIGMGRYGIKTGITQDELRVLIRNERRIELSFEEHRFWDVRRWKTAATDLTGALYGMQITKSGSTTTYTKIQIGTMLFQDKLYHMPIPYAEITKNSALLQNSGW